MRVALGDSLYCNDSINNAAGNSMLRFVKIQHFTSILTSVAHTRRTFYQIGINRVYMQSFKNY